MNTTTTIENGCLVESRPLELLNQFPAGIGKVEVWHLPKTSRYFALSTTHGTVNEFKTLKEARCAAEQLAEILRKHY